MQLKLVWYVRAILRWARSKKLKLKVGQCRNIRSLEIKAEKWITFDFERNHILPRSYKHAPWKYSLISSLFFFKKKNRFCGLTKFESPCSIGLPTLSFCKTSSVNQDVISVFRTGILHSCNGSRWQGKHFQWSWISGKTKRKKKPFPHGENDNLPFYWQWMVGSQQEDSHQTCNSATSEWASLGRESPIHECKSIKGW